MLKDLILKNRSYRRFQQSYPVKRATLEELVELARYSPSAANQQPLKYYISYAADKNAQIFPLLAWAGYLKDWGGPAEGERPSAYIIILGDTKIKTNFGLDPGIAAQSIMLGASEKGLGGCMIASIKRQELQQLLNLPESMEVILVLALGKPAEEVVVEDLGAEGDIKYYRDLEGRHHVPKRKLPELIIN